MSERAVQHPPPEMRNPAIGQDDGAQSQSPIKSSDSIDTAFALQAEKPLSHPGGRPMTLSLQQLASTLGGEVSGHQVLAPGPGHGPRDRSMSVKLGNDDYIVHSFATDSWRECRDYIDQKIGAPKTEQKSNTDPIGNGRSDVWAKGGGAEPRIPYRLPEMLAKPDAPVLIVEGEKGVENVMKLGDFVVTTNAGGAGNWHPDLNQYFKEREIYILPDNDEPGEKHAHLHLQNVEARSDGRTPARRARSTPVLLEHAE